MLSKTNREYRFLNIFQKIKLKTAKGGGVILFTDNEENSQALVSFKKYMPPPLPNYFKVNIYPFPLPNFASIFFAYL